MREIEKPSLNAPAEAVLDDHSGDGIVWRRLALSNGSYVLVVQHDYAQVLSWTTRLDPSDAVRYFMPRLFTRNIVADTTRWNPLAEENDVDDNEIDAHITGKAILKHLVEHEDTWYVSLHRKGYNGEVVFHGPGNYPSENPNLLTLVQPPNAGPDSHLFFDTLPTMWHTGTSEVREMTQYVGLRMLDGAAETS